MNLHKFTYDNTRKALKWSTSCAAWNWNRFRILLSMEHRISRWLWTILHLYKLGERYSIHHVNASPKGICHATPHHHSPLHNLSFVFFPPLIFQYFVFSLSNDIHSIHQHNVRFHEGKQTFSFSFLPMENRIIITVMIMRIAWEFWIFIIYVLAEEWRT